MSIQDRQRVSSALNYPDNTAGGLMNTDTITVRDNHSIDVVLRYLRRHDEIPEMTDNLFVVNREDDFIGILPLSKILVSDPSKKVHEIMLSNTEVIPVDMPDDDVARRFEKRIVLSAPVINEKGKLLGI